MPGFRVTNIISSIGLQDCQFAKLDYNNITCGGWRIERASLRKFEKDKLFEETEDYFVVLEGVVLNLRELINKYRKESWKDTILYLIRTSGEKWFLQLEGPLSGGVYYKREDKWVIFTGYLGEKALFYWSEDGKLIVGSQLSYLTDILKERGISRDPDEDALCRLMAYDSYIGNETCIKSVKRIYPGDYIVYQGGRAETHSYIKFDIKQDEADKIKTENEYIDALDESFICAMKRIFAKNEEYGYKTIIDLSGGYDSRMNVYTAKKLNAKNVILDCYGQSGCHDAMVASSIAAELNYTLIFQAMDNAECMYGVDENVRMLNGTTTYSGITGGRDMLKMLTGLNIGLEITGLLGDVHDGSMVISRCDGEIDSEDFRDSRTLIQGEDFIFPKDAGTQFVHHVNDRFWFYNRGMIYGMSSFFIRQNFTEAVTPFGDKSFLETYLSIPWEMRVKKKLMRKWLAVKYPAAAKYTNGRSGLTISVELSRIGDVATKVGKQVIKLKRRYRRRTHADGMYDVEFWYNHNGDFREYVDQYINNPPGELARCFKVSSAVAKLKRSDNIEDKLMIMTVYSIFKNFIS